MFKRSGFTLIELLVVVSIIALLMAILMPALQRVKRQSMAVACQSNLRQWGLYFSIYTDDNDGYFQREWNMAADRTWSWMSVLRPYYIQNRQILCCPTAKKLANEGGRVPFVAWNNFYNERGSYGINIWVSNPPPGREGGKPGANYWRRRDVSGAANIPLFLDDLWWDTRPHHTDAPPEFEGQVDDWTTNAMKMLCINRHSGFTNGVFADFSTRKVGLKELWSLKWHRNFDTNADPPVWPSWMRNLKNY